MKKNSRVFFEDATFSNLNSFLTQNQEKYSKIFLLTDSNVYQHCVPTLLNAVPLLVDVDVIEIEPGEEQKSIEIATQLWQSLLDNEADKNMLLINVGGGVVTDIGGFIAGTYKRGVDYVNIPTSLLGAVDAAIGGKTGLDMNHLKNQIGVIYPSQGVFVCSAFFDSLSDSEFYSGLAECVKHMILGNRGVWDRFVAYQDGHRQFVAENIRELAEVKCDIVAIDPYEKSERQFLNYGHTIGHALESYCLEKGIQITHGTAVVWGIICENMIAVERNYLDKAVEKDIFEVLHQCFSFPKIMEDAIPPILEFCKHDKKNENGEIRFSFLTQIGKMEAKQTANLEVIEKALKSTISLLN